MVVPVVDAVSVVIYIHDSARLLFKEEAMSMPDLAWLLLNSCRDYASRAHLGIGQVMCAPRSVPLRRQSQLEACLEATTYCRLDPSWVL